MFDALFLYYDMVITWACSERAPTPTAKRKRSVTPSERKGVNGGIDSGDDDVLRSPLAKRKKVAAERTGYSRLKEAITADELVHSETGDKAVNTPKMAEREVEDGEEGDDEDDEDDFLARELEEEWG